MDQDYTRACEEDKEDGVEKAKSQADDDFVDDSGDKEGHKLGQKSVFSEENGKPSQIDIYIVVEPVMHNDVPFSVVSAKFDRIPPIGVEGSIRESCDF